MSMHCNFGKKGLSPTVALFLEMMESIHDTGKVVTDDSGFCVTQGVLALHDMPKEVPGDNIDHYM